MGQILSHSEVESVLSALDFGSTPSESLSEPVVPRSANQVSLYDFEHPEPLRRSQMDALRLAAASASQSLQTGLSKVLQSSLIVKFLGVEQSTYRDYLITAESPSCIAVLESVNSTGRLLLEISRSLAFTFIDCMLGGKPFETNTIPTLPRPYSDVETRLIDRAISAILPGLAASLAQWTELKLMRLIDDSLLIHEATSNEAVALISFEVLCGSKQGMMQLCVPWKLVTQAINPSVKDGRDFRDVLRSGAVKIPVVATARVTHLKLSTRDLASLKPGDVLLTDTSSSDEMTLEVDGCEIFRGNPGQSQNHKVIRLTVPITSEAIRTGVANSNCR